MAAHGNRPPAIVKTAPAELNLSDSPIPAIPPTLPKATPPRKDNGYTTSPAPDRSRTHSHSHSPDDHDHHHSHSHSDHSHSHSHSHSAGHDHHTHSHSHDPSGDSRPVVESNASESGESTPLIPSEAPVPPPAVTSTVPISAPKPQKAPSPLPLAAGSPPTPISRTPDPRLAEYRRRSATPDAFKDVIANGGILRGGSPRIGSPRLGSPRVTSFGGTSGLGFGIGLDRKPSLGGIGVSQVSPTASRSPGVGLGMTGAFGRKVVSSTTAVLPSASHDTDEENEEGSEGETRDGSITSVD